MRISQSSTASPQINLPQRSPQQCQPQRPDFLAGFSPCFLPFRDTQQLFLHLISTPSRTPRYPPLIQFLLQSRNLLQALRTSNQRFHPLLLFIRQFDAVGFVACTSGAVGERRGGGWDVEGAGFDAGDLKERTGQLVT